MTVHGVMLLRIHSLVCHGFLWVSNYRGSTNTNKSWKSSSTFSLKKVDDKQKIPYDLSNCSSILDINQRFIYVYLSLFDLRLLITLWYLKTFFQSHMSCASGGGHRKTQTLVPCNQWLFMYSLEKVLNLCTICYRVQSKTISMLGSDKHPLLRVVNLNTWCLTLRM